TELTGTINQTAWNSAPDGLVTIRFYTKDKAGNIGVASAILIQSPYQP
ncbi:unnamed protein product, partial [marine sediment metagenome]